MVNYTYRGRNSVTMHRCGVVVTAPMKSKIFGCRSFFMRDTFKKYTKTVACKKKSIKKELIMCDEKNTSCLNDTINSSGYS